MMVYRAKVPLPALSDRFLASRFRRLPRCTRQDSDGGWGPVTLVGVNPASFTGPAGVEATSPQIFLPLSMLPAIDPFPGDEAPLIDPNQFWLSLMARVKPEISKPVRRPHSTWRSMRLFEEQARSRTAKPFPSFRLKTEAAVSPRGCAPS